MVLVILLISFLNPHRKHIPAECLLLSPVSWQKSKMAGGWRRQLLSPLQPGRSCSGRTQCSGLNSSIERTSLAWPARRMLMPCGRNELSSCSVRAENKRNMVWVLPVDVSQRGPWCTHPSPALPVLRAREPAPRQWLFNSPVNGRSSSGWVRGSATYRWSW